MKTSSRLLTDIPQTVWQHFGILTLLVRGIGYHPRKERSDCGVAHLFNLSSYVGVTEYLVRSSTSVLQGKVDESLGRVWVLILACLQRVGRAAPSGF